MFFFDKIFVGGSLISVNNNSSIDFVRNSNNEINKQLTREAIEIALFHLLENKKLKEIHVVELVKKAGVSRSGFYKNYSSVEDVLIGAIDKYFCHLIIEFSDDIYNNWMTIIKTFRKYQKYLIILYRSGYFYFLLRCFNQRLKDDQYYYLAWNGLVFNFLLLWVKNDMKESDEEIFAIIKKTLNEMAKAINTSNSLISIDGNF